MRLAASANENEAANALAMAQKLMEKHGITAEAVEEKEVKPVYTDEELLFQSESNLEWIDQLTFAVADKYDCYIIKEKITASTGDEVYKYYVYGEDVDAIYVKEVFKLLHSQMVSVIDKNTIGRGPLFITSYCEGLVHGVKVNLMFEDFELKGMVETKTEAGPGLTKVEVDKKEPPLKEKQEVKKASQEKPLDILAYFRGEGDGRKIHIGEADSDNVPNLLTGMDLSQLFKDS